MRPLSELSKNGQVTHNEILEDTVLDFIDDVVESNVNCQFLLNSVTENQMAAVFPSRPLPDNGLVLRNKSAMGSNVQEKSENVSEHSETICKIVKHVIVVNDSSLDDDSHSKGRYVQHRNNNNLTQPEVGMDNSHSSKYRCQKGGKGTKSVTGKTSSGFHNTIVEALIEKPKLECIEKTEENVLENKRDISDNNDKTISSSESRCGMWSVPSSSSYPKSASQTDKFPCYSPSGLLYSSTQTSTTAITKTTLPTSCSSSSSSVESQNSFTNVTLVARSSDVNESQDLPTAIESGCQVLPLAVGSRCQDVPLVVVSRCQDGPLAVGSRGQAIGPGCSSLSSNHPQITVARVKGKSSVTLTSVSQLPAINNDDAITTEIVPEPLTSDKAVQSSMTVQDGIGKGRKSLSARISKRLVTFFQKRPINTSFPDSRTDCQDQRVTNTTETTHEKEPSRPFCFTGKLKTSVAEWRRKPSNRSQTLSRERNKHGPDAKEKPEKKKKNKGRIPIFVSPQEQVEILEEVPERIMEEQKRILRESWLLIQADVTDVGVEAFMGLFHTHPDSIDSFLAFKDKAIEDIEQSAVLKAHALRVMQTVDKCITRIDDIDKMAAVLCQLGKRHIGYRANARLIPIIGKQFISAIEPKMADKWSDEVEQAWDILFRTINYNLRRGMMQEKHRLKDEAVTKKKK